MTTQTPSPAQTSDEPMRAALTEVKQFLGDMHTMPVAWTIWDSQRIYLTVCDALATPGPTVDVERDAQNWQALLKDVVSEMPNKFPGRSGNAPFHGHSVPGIWDSDNGAKAGTECVWCKAWNTAQEAITKGTKP